MSLKHGLLGLLNYIPMSGYELIKDFNESLGLFWHTTGSQIYYDLSAMEEKGWLISERIIQEDKPNKRVYTITPQGKAELVRWLSAPPTTTKSSIKQRNALLIRIFFGAEVDKEKTLELLRSFRDECLEVIKSMDVIDDAISQAKGEIHPNSATYWGLAAECGYIMNKARIMWAEKAISTLEKQGGGQHD